MNDVCTCAKPNPRWAPDELYCQVCNKDLSTLPRPGPTWPYWALLVVCTVAMVFLVATGR